jgi:hypothetical protein
MMQMRRGESADTQELRERKGPAVPRNEFEPAEIAELADLCARCSGAWRWLRRRGQAGEDLIEIEMDDGRCERMRLRKANGAYAVTGFRGWGLAIFEDLAAVIRALAEHLCGGAPASLALPEAE